MKVKMMANNFHVCTLFVTTHGKERRGKGKMAVNRTRGPVH